MKTPKDTDFNERRKAASDAKKALLEKLKTKADENDPALQARLAERAARAEAKRIKEEARRAEAERKRLEEEEARRIEEERQAQFARDPIARMIAEQAALMGTRKRGGRR